jgi:hypothetical protein
MVFVGSHCTLTTSGGGSPSPGSQDDMLWFQGSSDLQNRWAVVAGPPGPQRQLDLVQKLAKARVLRRARVASKIGVIGHRFVGVLELFS